MKQITKTFLKGLIAVVPITLTLYLLYWLAVTAEVVLGNIFKVFLPNNWYIHGLGFVSGLAAVFLSADFWNPKTFTAYSGKLNNMSSEYP